MTDRKQIGKILLRQRALTPDQLERALTEKKGGRLASRLAAEGTITDLSALKALSEQHGIPGIDLGQICLRLETLDLLPREIAEKHLILPVLMRDDRLFVATANPREHKVLDELEFVTGKKVYPYVALESSLEHVIDDAYGRKARGESFFVGAQCPQAMLDKLRIDREGQPLAPETPPPDAPDSQRLHAPGVVVDDEVGALSRSDDIEERDIDALQREDSVVEPIPEADLRESVIPSPRPGAKTILIVDDELEIRRMLSRLLAKAGYRVLEADRGVTALRVVKEQAIDLIVLDAMLPEVHGFDVARRIKNSKRYGSIPIVMVSAVYRGWRYAEDLRQTLGVDDFIEKPFTLQDVLGRVQALLGTKEPSVQPPGDGVALPPDTSAEIERCLTQGIEAYRAGHLDEAVEHLRRGVAIDPLAFRLRFQLGLLYGRKGQVFDAVNELETAVSVNPHHFPAVKNLAILYQKAGFRNKAVETWERALALAPDDATRLSIREHLLKLL